MMKVIAKNKQQKQKNKSYGQYCLQFCREGICRKGRHCSFEHDPSKRGICQRILTQQLCRKPICHLSHDKTPDKMPDCRFFLRGKCTADNCQYRHVKVNKDAKLCENFASGFCLQGLSCNKLHQFKCSAIGQRKKCPRGDQCNNYHPPKIVQQQQQQQKSPKKKKLQKESKFKKINKPLTNAANNTNNNQSLSSPKHNQSNELPLDLSSPNTKNLLNQMLTKQFQKNHHLNNSKRIDESRSLVNHDGNDDDDEDDKSIIKKIIENLSFIPLTKDGDTFDNDSLKIDWIQLIRRFHNDNDDGQSSNIEKPKYFTIDDSDDDEDDNGLLNLSLKPPPPSTTTSTTSILMNETNIYRPKLKIIPDFLQE
uniref:Zinc finger CCCH domain-containing protein 3-like n=1 Tax=Dermatophagoides pteronyssinus TaxID=6956 RepID=A0A6P6Y5Z0_DERPT|nr:zinc finger CCCH domain-containing protein 3-like [Dermatophagoides pteronyssinus]